MTQKEKEPINDYTPEPEIEIEEDEEISPDIINYYE
ncbi:MAG: hypothetical protein MRERV_8c045 [Mycoplasmataceae bacterium RV_VA103A]|nr:MAG: hypothetical protein MRERV_8c045 [Mycoplasmataceae bacterium RV_VA103A]